MANWSTTKKVLVFGGGGLVLLFIIAGIFGSSEKKTSSTTTATAGTSLQAKADAFGACVGKIPGMKWQKETPTVGRPTKWDSLPKEKIEFGGQTIAIHAGTGIYTATPSFWSSFWVADSPADAAQAAKTLSDPKNEASTSNMVDDAGRTEKYGSWSIAGQAPAEQGLGSAVEFDSTASDSDIQKMDTAAIKTMGDATIVCLKKNGLLRS